MTAENTSEIKTPEVNEVPEVRNDGWVLSGVQTDPFGPEYKAPEPEPAEGIPGP